VMGGEDFAFYQQEIPGVFFFLGTASEQADSAHSWHHPRYNIDEACFRVGIPLMTALALHHHDTTAA
jgi:amidohydrolase